MNEKFAHWNVLFIEYLKRDWKKLLGWIVGLGGFVGGLVPAFVELGKGQGLIGMYETMKNPAMISMIGTTPVKEASDYTVGAMYSHEMLLFSGLFAMIIAALHIVSHTRKEEESGLTEFVCSYRVGRHANSLALFVEMLLTHIVMAVFIGALMASFGEKTIDIAGSLLFGLSVGMAGMIGVVIALMISQIMPSHTGAVGMTIGIIGMLYMLRGGTDIYNTDWSMFNPMGWTYMTFPFTENKILPLIFALAFCVIIAIISFALESGRDMGAGYLKEKSGSAKVSKSLLSVPGLLFRLNRTAIISWSVAFICLGGAYGSVYGEMQSFMESNELISMMFAVDGVSLEASFTSVILVIMAGLVAILPVVIVNKLSAEEMSGHMSQLFATKVSRAKLYWTTMIIAAVSGAVGCVLSSGGLGAVGISVMKNDSLELSDFLATGINYLPAILFITGLAALVLGWIPKLAKLIYVYIGYSIMMNYFLKLLNLPEWFEKTAILSWIPRMPVEKFDGLTFAVITVISIIMMVLGYVGYQKRDLQK